MIRIRCLWCVFVLSWLASASDAESQHHWQGGNTNVAPPPASPDDLPSPDETLFAEPGWRDESEPCEPEAVDGYYTRAVPERFAEPSARWVAAYEPVNAGPLEYCGTELRAGPALTRATYGENLGITIQPYLDPYERTYRPADDNLPGAVDPNDVQSQAIFDTQSLDVAVPITPLFLGALPGYATDPTDPKMRLGLQARPGIFYDTGFVGTTFFPPNIALDGTDDAHKRGQLTFFNFLENEAKLPLRSQVDLQALDLFNLTVGQVYLDAAVPDDEFQARSLFARFLSETQSSAIVVGKLETTFGDLATVPVLIQNAALPIGAIAPATEAGADKVFDGIAQIRYSRFWEGTRYEVSGAIEDQSKLSDVRVESGVTRLNQYPAFVGRFRHQPGGLSSLQVSGMVRPLVIDDPQFADHTTTGWGISGNMRMFNAAQTDALFIGATTGDGIGGYIYGGTLAAFTPTTSSIETLSNTGAYAGYQHVWYVGNAKDNLSSYFGYGYVHGDAPTANDNRVIHQAWANLLWNINERVATGFEYQFGSREVGDGRDGDNHRFMFVLQIQAQPSGTLRRSYAREYGGPEELTLSDFRL